MPNWILDTISDLRADTSKEYGICSGIWRQNCERTAFREEGESTFFQKNGTILLYIRTHESSEKFSATAQFARYS